MNNQVVTVGLKPLTIGSTDRFKTQAWLNDVPWDLTGGTAVLRMTDPNGTAYSFPAVISGGGAHFDWRVVGPTGIWLRAWDLVDATGLEQISEPIAFQVINSPS